MLQLILHLIIMHGNRVFFYCISGMRVWGVDNQVLRNLVILMVFPGTFYGRSELRTEWEGAIEVNEGVRPILQGNHVAGSERTGAL